MKFPMRLIARITFLAVVIVLLLTGLVLAWFTSWRSDKMAELEGSSEIVKTKMGPVEYVTAGEGPVVLVFHGAPGGYDQAMLLGAGLREAGFQIIAPSRPGYLRTPLTTGLLPEQQADAMAALLDDLGVQSAAVLGFSEGAPVAVFFAQKYPERVAALALVAPVTKRSIKDNSEELRNFGRDILRGLTGDMGAWFGVEIADRDPVRGLNWLLELTSKQEPLQRSTAAHLIAASAKQLEWYRSLMSTFAPLSLREAGTRNDIVQIRAPLELPFAKVQTPTLLIHGEADLNVPIEDSREAVAKIPGAKLIAVPEAGHIVQLGTESAGVQKSLTDFFLQHTGGHPNP